MVCRFWVVCHFSVVGLSHEISMRWEKCPAMDQPGCEHARLQEAHFPNQCQCFDAKMATPTFVSTSAIPEFPRIQRGVLEFQRLLRTESRSRWERFLRLCCHLINNYCFRFSERRPEMRWLSEDSKLLPELVDQQIVSQKP